MSWNTLPTSVPQVMSPYLGTLGVSQSLQYGHGLTHPTVDMVTIRK